MLQYKTQSAAELNAIFKKRRARTDHQGAPLGLPPDFSPVAPSYDVPDSDSESHGPYLLTQLGHSGSVCSLASENIKQRERKKESGSCQSSAAV